MFKTTVFIILAILMVTPVWSSSSIRSYEDYLLLSDREKNEYIIKAMELMVELEDQYERDVKKYGFNQERYEKFVRAISKIQSILFIDSAIAADRKAPARSPKSTKATTTSSSSKSAMSEWTDFANSFVQLTQKGQYCIFAGWVSKPVKAGNTTVCNHPNFTEASSEFNKNYPVSDSKECGKDDRKHIQCNPAIFGYKSSESKSLFCVDADNGAHNSSYLCMKKALDESDKQEGDKKDKRLDFLRQNLSQNPALFEGVQQFIYKTCVCDKASGGLNQQYHKYIRPHRTCYGMMEMLASTTSCAIENVSVDTTIFQKLHEVTKDKILSDGNNSSIEKVYRPFIEGIKKSSSEQYNQLCGGATKPETPAKKDEKLTTPEVAAATKYVCEAKCKSDRLDAKDQDLHKCTYTLTEEGKSENLTIEPPIPELQKISGDTKAITHKGKIKTGDKEKEVEISCAVTISGPETANPGETKKEPNFSVKLDSTTEKEAKIKATNDAEKEGWIFKWTKNGPGKSKSAKKDNVDGLAGNSGEESTSTPETPTSDEMSITKERTNETYKVCGTISKGSDTKPELCTDVPKLETKAPVKPVSSTTGGGPTPPPTQMRGSSDTSAMGIK